MLPAEVSFPEVLKRVAVVNNTPLPSTNPFLDTDTCVYQGEANIALEALAETLAAENYFDEVVIYDSTLCHSTSKKQEDILSMEETNQLIEQLDVDFLIALEELQIQSIRKVKYLPELNLYQGTTDVKVFPTVRIYLPNRKAPMATLHCNDSIFWEEHGPTENYVRSRSIKNQEVLKQASDFAGTIPVRLLLPSWKTANRYIFCNGSVNMRDAIVYVREKDWSEAIKLWDEVYQKKKGKQKMYAAYNIALGYEMQDSIATAYEWALKSQEVAKELDEVDKMDSEQRIDSYYAPNYVMTTLYLGELKVRLQEFNRLKMQMERFQKE